MVSAADARWGDAGLTSRPTSADASTLEDALQRALELAIDIVPGCEQAGISMQRGKRVETPASVGPLANACDRLQEQLGAGPCVTALREADVVRIDDVLTDGRWPDFTEASAQLGLRSMFACRLATTRDVLGALNLYSTEPGAFDDDSENLALGYATHVGLALSALDKEKNLRKAMESRELIGQAMGILMERHRTTASQAFDLMSTCRAQQRQAARHRQGTRPTGTLTALLATTPGRA